MVLTALQGEPKKRGMPSLGDIQAARSRRHPTRARCVSVHFRLMDIDLAALPDEVDALQRLVRDLAAERESERNGLAEAQAEIERLKLIVHKLQHSQFGRCMP